MPLLPLAPLDRLLAPAPEPGKVAWIARQEFAHRGFHAAGTPENSLAAFEAAIAQGWGIECDVQRSRDGQPMVFHDWKLDRLTEHAGGVARFIAEQLCRMELRGGKGTIPTLDAALSQIAGRVPLLIEIKTRRERRVANFCLAVHATLKGYVGPHAVMSFDPRVTRWFFRHAPDTVRGLVVTENENRSLSGAIRRRLALWHARPDFLAYDVRDLPSRFAAEQRARGLPIATWTVRAPEQRKRAQASADAVIAEADGFSCTAKDGELTA
ncbi:glycerophosphodiester phosphodiesterase family protein [Novosphingobium sp. M1R2S20]|uniref:Glycerophosphodiester phosphodiesterase family protein n=1 Tax=Novosphingobium rhizovicinum TaxID=3228928 RepID=A0ABV3RA85_9SPHN